MNEENFEISTSSQMEFATWKSVSHAGAFFCGQSLFGYFASTIYTENVLQNLDSVAAAVGSWQSLQNACNLVSVFFFSVFIFIERLVMQTIERTSCCDAVADSAGNSHWLLIFCLCFPFHFLQCNRCCVQSLRRSQPLGGEVFMFFAMLRQLFEDFGYQKTHFFIEII